MSDLKEIFADIDVEEWLDHVGLDARKTSSGQLILSECPWCGGKKAYLRADDGRGICYSGSCQETFNLFSLARHHLSLSTPATFAHFEAYAAGAGIRSHRAPVEKALVVPIDWAMPSSVPLPTPEGHTHPFLTERGITFESQRLYDLRWCEKGFFRFSNAEGIEKFMPFSGRVIIPVVDLDGTIQTFQGRATWAIDEEIEKRYLFPPTLPGSGRFIFGANIAKGKSHLVMGEGPFDTIAIHQAIYGNLSFKEVGAIGSFGLTVGSGNEDGNDQLSRFRALRRDFGLRVVTIMWDGEARALNAALEAGMLLRRQNLIVRIALLPKSRDPNEVESWVVREAIDNSTLLNEMTYLQLKHNSPYT